MKFGKYLEKQTRPEWRAYYLDYNGLKDLLKESARAAETAGPAAFSPRTTSLSIVRANKNTDAAEERFFQQLEKEVRERSELFVPIAVPSHNHSSTRGGVNAPRRQAYNCETLLSMCVVSGQHLGQLQKYSSKAIQTLHCSVLSCHTAPPLVTGGESGKVHIRHRGCPAQPADAAESSC